MFAIWSLKVFQMASLPLQSSCSVLLCIIYTDIKIGLFILINIYILVPRFRTLAMLFFPLRILYSQFLLLKIFLILSFLWKPLGPSSLQHTATSSPEEEQRGGRCAWLVKLAQPVTRSQRCNFWSSNFKLQNVNFFLLARVTIVPRRQPPN